MELTYIPYCLRVVPVGIASIPLMGYTCSQVGQQQKMLIALEKILEQIRGDICSDLERGAFSGCIEIGHCS